MRPGFEDDVMMGVQNLRIVDAPVFPKVPGCFIVTPVYMIAEKASDHAMVSHGSI